MAHQITGKDGFSNPHKVLNGNISVLLNFHPPPDDQFKNSINENMFMVPNKKGFFEVTNYLNSIIDKEKWNSIITWPVINNKDEMKFRRAVVKFTAELNSLYVVQVVPTLNPSVLISPGGLQVARFISKLSEYAIRKYMQESLGFENKLECLKLSKPTSNSAKLKLDTVSLHRSVQCLNKLEATRKNIKYAVDQRQHMQQQLFKLRASNDAIEREIIQEAPDNNSQEHVSQWSNELNKRMEERQSYVDYLAGIDDSVTRYHQAANTILEKGASNLILDGSKIRSPTANDEASPTDLTRYFKSSAAIAKRLALGLKSSESKQEDTQLASSVQSIESEISLERMRLENLEKDILSEIAQSKEGIRVLEPKAFSCIIDEEQIPSEIKNYTASPVFSFAKTKSNARRLPIVCPPRENHILDWVKTNLFKETENVPSNRNTPLKRETVSFIPKKINNGLAGPAKESPIRVQHNLLRGSATPRRNSSVHVRRLLQESKPETPKGKLEDSIVLPHNLSTSTASPCNSPNSHDSPAPSIAVSSIPSPNTWAENNEIDIFSSTPFVINHNSVCSLPTGHQSPASGCQSSPSGLVHLPADMITTGNRQRRMRPSLENIIERYKAIKRNQLEKSDE